MTFGERLKQERDRLGLTSEELAASCSVSRSYITLIENGKRMPSTKIIPRIAAGLDLKVHTVVNWYLEDMAQKVQDKAGLKGE